MIYRTLFLIAMVLALFHGNVMAGHKDIMTNLAKRNNSTPAPQPIKYDLAVCAIFRDEAPYLEEWIEFHLLVGVKHFFLYNNLSKDDFLPVLQPYIDEGIVELINWPYNYADSNHKAWRAIQAKAYNQALEKFGNACEWMAFIDTDEFLFSPVSDHLIDILNDYANFGGLCVNWVLFGTSHVAKIPHDQLLLETFLLRGPAGFSSQYKSIVRPKCVSLFNNGHTPVYKPPFYPVNAYKQCVDKEVIWASELCIDQIRINHYWTRDENYFLNYKLASRKRRGKPVDADLQRAARLNEELDNSMTRFVPTLRQQIARRKTPLQLSLQ